MDVCSDLKIPIYNVWMQIVLVDDIWKYYESTNTIGLKEEVDTYQAVTIDAFNNPNKRFGYYTVFTPNSYSVGTIAHEALHITVSILNRLDTPLNRTTEEVYAYLLTYLVDEITEILIKLELSKEQLEQP